jgi:hypothetical protein
MKSENLLLVSGTGRNSGKTTFVCKIIEQFCHLGIISIKISSHFHDASEGLILLTAKTGYMVFEETNRKTRKDSSRMLRSGAEKVYYIQADNDKVFDSFTDVFKIIDRGRPVICESPSLINYIEPGLFVMMINNSGNNPKSIEPMRKLPHAEFTYDEIVTFSALPVDFAESRWKKL